MDLQQFFKENPRVAIAFSGGVDSSYLLYAALRYGARVRAYYVNSAFQPRFELEDARRLAGDLHADLRELQVDVLSSPIVTANPPDRCYHCKRVIFRTIAAAAAEDGFPVLLDGTNASDDAGDRPGMRALRELSVRSPLRECGLTKDEIRRLSREAGLFTWDKPAYACLATRIPTGQPITARDLAGHRGGGNVSVFPGLYGFPGPPGGPQRENSAARRPDAPPAGAPAGDPGPPGAGLRRRTGWTWRQEHEQQRSAKCWRACARGPCPWMTRCWP